MKRIILPLIIASTLTGCKQEQAEVVQSVSWYKENTIERAERLAQCRANPGELSDTPNCVNAEQAERRAETCKGGGLDAQSMLDVKLGRERPGEHKPLYSRDSVARWIRLQPPSCSLWCQTSLQPCTPGLVAA